MRSDATMFSKAGLGATSSEDMVIANS